MKHKPLPSVRRLNELLSYSRSTGVFNWKVSPTNKVAKGSVAGTQMNNGYVHIQIDKVLYLAHRLAWLITTREDPGAAQIDHRNGVRHDNRRRNLRLAPRKEADNMQNRAMGSNCKSGHVGVYWNKWKQKWQAYIGVGRKLIRLGDFTTRDEAVQVRRAAKAKYHEFQKEQRA